MNLLLLLSALLSALTGVAASTRGPELTQAVATTAVQRARPAERRIGAVRPAASLPTLAALAGTYVPEAPSLRAIEPLFANRRRE